MKKKIDIISETPLFGGLPENQLEEIKQIALDRSYSKGETIFLEGDDGNGFYVVVEGRIKIYKVSSEGKEQILHIFGAGEPFGELRRFTVQIENLSLKEVPSRLAAYLIYLAEEQGRRDSVKLHISKGQLASLLGTIPETLSRIFAKMSAQNLIQVYGRDINLLDFTGLEALAE